MTTALIIKLDDIEKKSDVVQELRELNQDFFIDNRLEIARIKYATCTWLYEETINFVIIA